MRDSAIEVTEENEVDIVDLNDRKNALLADHNLFLSTGFVDPKEKNRKMKDRKKKKKLGLQHNRQNVLSCESNSQSHSSQPIVEQREYYGSKLEEFTSNGRHLSSIATHSFKRGSINEHVDTDVEIERQKLLKSWSPRPPITFDLRFIVAPMVNQSDPPFRTLCLKYGATCAYTEMLYSHRIVLSESYLSKRLQEVDHSFFLRSATSSSSSSLSYSSCSSASTSSSSSAFPSASSSSSFSLKSDDNQLILERCMDSKSSGKGYGGAGDRSTNTNTNTSTEQSDSDQSGSYQSYSSRPLIVQICGNDPVMLSRAVLKIREHSKRCPVDAIDFNLGCPQDRAKEGSKLLI
jgi:Dihydrouridine synthase (Dus)